jgi:nickel-dependent lactate racemase
MSNVKDEEESATELRSLMCSIGSESTVIDDAQLRKELYSFLNQLGPKEDVLLVPPDYTRFHSKAGKITRMIAEYYKFIPRGDDDGSWDQTKADGPQTTNTLPPPHLQIMPALGTHAPMTQEQIEAMYGIELAKLRDPSPFLVHDWRNDVETIGYVPNEMVREATRGMVDKPWPAQLNKLVWSKRRELTSSDNCDEINQNHKKTVVLSIGQVVPHEVMGMANYNKNLFVGVGGLDAINLSHFIGAVYGMENMMGRADNPLRAILNYASQHLLEGKIELWYILTVVDPNLDLKGLYIGNSIDCYSRACDLSLKVNFTLLDKAPSTIVVYLDEDEFHSTWLGNKSIYRTRLAIADGGNLIVLAPGVKRFGEDDQVDLLIRKFGYVGTPQIMKRMDEDEELRDNLGAVAHLIHGSTEGRFTVTYCPSPGPDHLTKEEIEGVGFQYAPLDEMAKKYPYKSLSDGWQLSPSGEEYFFIANPALGLWAVRSRFQTDDKSKDGIQAGDEGAVTKKQKTSDDA